ncbi:PREDICTED: replication factor C subunit 3 [Thamnophis sirtalis]|uniref:Replication factor C subunit 3 n=1 Tax=Thamnophis sirtalis TaxID=35019 RepID=A0A6I9WZB2_9SAUR|nr:PREDICTED: replication factor C subunit 3 [Thamnophis sirtalis]
MSLWVDKYRPTLLCKVDYHREQAAQLRNLVQCGDFPHLLVYGPSGAGKKTRIMCLLRELYGSGVEKLRIEHQNITAPSKKKIEISTIASNYHLEVNPSDAGNSDRVVIQELLKTVAQSQQLETNTQRDFKVVLLTEVDKLTKDAQHALRRTMEKYMATCRLILCCNSTSKVIAPIRSRCLAVRVPAPSIGDICTILSNVCKKEGLTLPQELARRIAEKSGRNLRKALLMCEACRVQQLPFTPDQDISEADWEVYLRETANAIVSQQTPQRLFEVRGRLYELLTHCIPADIIIKLLTKNPYVGLQIQPCTPGMYRLWIMTIVIQQEKVKLDKAALSYGKFRT